MAYDPTLATAIDRVRFAVGDTAATPLLPDATYTALIATYGESGAAGQAAGALAVLFAQKPGSVTLPNGLSVSWASRVSAWQRIASGAAGVGAVSFAAGAARGDGYAASAAEYTAGDARE